MRNQSREVVRFLHRNMYDGVILQLEKKTKPGWGSGFSIPTAVLLRAASVRPPSFSVDRFTWSAVDRLPTVTLPTGQSYSLRIPLREALSGHADSPPIPPGEYDIRLSSKIDMLIGSQTGQFADLAPVRLLAAGSGTLTVR